MKQFCVPYGRKNNIAFLIYTLLTDDPLHTKRRGGGSTPSSIFEYSVINLWHPINLKNQA